MRISRSYALDLDDADDVLALSPGTVSRWQEQCDQLLASLMGQAYVSAEEVHRTAVRLTWEFFYSWKGSVPAEHAELLGVYLNALDRLHAVWLDVDKPTLVQERIVKVVEPAPPPSPVPPKSTAEALTEALGRLY